MMGKTIWYTLNQDHDDVYSFSFLLFFCFSFCFSIEFCSTHSTIILLQINFFERPKRKTKRKNTNFFLLVFLFFDSLFRIKNLTWRNVRRNIIGALITQIGFTYFLLLLHCLLPAIIFTTGCVWVKWKNLVFMWLLTVFQC